MSLQGKVSPKIATFADDVDGRGNNLHVFAREFFSCAVAKGLGAILVDYPVTSNIINGMPRTLADDLRENNTPYWYHVRADSIIALYTEMKYGREVVTHVRIRECATQRDGAFGEVNVDRIRVLEPGRWELWEKKVGAGYEKISAGMWLGVPDTATVAVHTDFAGDASNTDEAKVIADAQKRNVISKKTEREELQRRSILGPQFDGEVEDQQIADETLGLEAEVQIDPVIGKPIDPSKRLHGGRLEVA